MPASGPKQSRAGSPAGKRSRPTYIGHHLDGMLLEDLSSLLNAFLFATDALLAIYNQPRMGFPDEGDGKKNAAVALLSDEMDRLLDMCSEIDAEAARRSPTDGNEAQAKGEIRIAWAMRCGQEWNKIAAMATEASELADIRGGARVEPAVA
jgi:hypothetical protein